MPARAGRNDPCPCGSGKKFKKCHFEIDRQVEASSRGARLSIRDKNLLLVTEAADIFGFTRGVTWGDLRKELSADQVRKLYEVVGALWPPGVDVTEYLPKPESHLRALYLGDIHPQKLARNVTRFGLYADEILIIDPLRSPWAFSEEYSPILRPEIWKTDTLRVAYFLAFIAPWVLAGVAQIIPSPADYDGKIREATWRAAERRMARPEMAEIMADTSDVRDWGLDEWERALAGVPRDALEVNLRERMPHLSDDEIEGMLSYMERRREEDPLLLDQPLTEEGQLLVARTGANLELALYIAHLTGAFPYTNLQARRKELQLAREDLPRAADPWTPLSQAFDSLEFEFLNSVSPEFAVSLRKDGRLDSFRVFLRRVWGSVSTDADLADMEREATAFSEELRDEHRKANAEWKDIRADALKWAGVTASSAVVAGHFVPEFAIPGYSLAVVTQLLSALRQRRSFRERVPMSVFMDLERKAR